MKLAEHNLIVKKNIIFRKKNILIGKIMNKLKTVIRKLLSLIHI